MIPGVEPLSEHAFVAPPTGSRHILIVDDALPVRRKLLEILHRLGVPAGHVHLAADKEAGLEAFALKHPCIVLCELVGEDVVAGLDMVREMLSIDPHARVVLVTAEARDSPAIRAAIRAGVFGIVEKPLRQDAIRQMLAQIDAEESSIVRFR